METLNKSPIVAALLFRPFLSAHRAYSAFLGAVSALISLIGRPALPSDGFIPPPVANTAGQNQIGQPKQPEHLRRFLFHSTVANLSAIETHLDHLERMLELGDVGHVGGRTYQAVYQPRRYVDTIWASSRSYTGCPFLTQCTSGLRLPYCLLTEGGTASRIASKIAPSLSRRPGWLDNG